MLSKTAPNRTIARKYNCALKDRDSLRERKRERPQNYSLSPGTIDPSNPLVLPKEKLGGKKTEIGKTKFKADQTAPIQRTVM